MIALTSFVAIAAGFVAFTQSKPLESRAAVDVSNAKSSLTLIYQNNLNQSDDKYHIGALVLDPVPQSGAAAACASLNEKLLPKSNLQQHKSDFINALSYQNYADYYNAGNGFFVDDGVVTVDGQLRFASASAHSHQQLPVLCTQSANNGSSSAGPVNGSQVSVASGGNTFVGYRNQKSFRFLGIPYADTPQRWKYSSLYSKRGQTIQATAYGSQCAQGGSGSEDCLFLNIQTPYIPKADSKKNLRPVMFWIHGGGFTGGSGADPLSDGGNLASKEDIVVVNINYRLSTLGFLAIPGTDIKGNYGIADQIVALEWTIANIASFGGDPKQITIIGESAGAGSVRTLLGSPQAIGKYQGGVAMSNLGGGVTLGLNGDYGTTYSSYYTISQSYAVAGQQIFASAGCNSSVISAQISCLEKVPALQLVGFPTVARYVVQDGKYVNTEQLIVSKRNASTAHVPVIFGNTANDGASFSTYPKTPVANLPQGLQAALGINSTWAQKVIDSGLFPYYNTGNMTLDSFNVSQRVATDKTFRCVDEATVYAGSETGAFEKAYYERTINGYDPNNLGGPKDNNPNNPYFRFHGADMPWVFGTLSTIRDPADLYSVQLVSSYFAAFVKNGDPNPDLEYLRVRGYDKVAEGVRRTGNWEEASGTRGEVRHLDWPGYRGGFVDVAQCSWLGYPLDYYLNGGK
ncbi:alpha/beta-hydrolase [Trematosphaeria pertusa]|uniref:Carboxylic ester hydrolase n=1 Tax=Trematosphaeria pertusa TaxID=390896 RepID=A0A6A6HZY8_9PLEO|nr:alpha/beta-hydrolase [Trematosphaeria pertusa]KAF2243597.1 alpha/beta-hydrolase [Trematosphaeria pertusa]